MSASCARIQSCADIAPVLCDHTCAPVSYYMGHKEGSGSEVLGWGMNQVCIENTLRVLRDEE